MNGTMRARFVVIGASNVSHSFAELVALVRAAHDAPLEIVAAHGHGRSWVSSSRVLFVRELPSIAGSGLWRVLHEREASQTTALLTDIGNDLAYGFGAERSAEAIERGLDALLALRARIVVTRLPLASLAHLGRVRFAVAKLLLFPGRDIDLERVRDDALALDARLVEFARMRGIELVTPPLEWYGFDPIHIRRAQRTAAFRTMLAPLFGEIRARSFPSDDAARVRRARPAERRLFGRDQRHEQPGVRCSDGTTVSWY